jgi:hypothetical protein
LSEIKKICWGDDNPAEVEDTFTFVQGEAGKQLHLTEIYLATFVESIDETNRQAYEVDYRDPDTAVTVKPIFIRTGKP